MNNRRHSAFLKAVYFILFIANSTKHTKNNTLIILIITIYTQSSKYYQYIFFRFLAIYSLNVTIIKAN